MEYPQLAPEVIDLSSRGRTNDFFQARVWVTRDGRELFVWDMTLEHLVNTLRLLKRAAPAIHDAEVMRMIRYGSGPLGPHGDMATDMFDNEFDRLIESDPWEWLKATPLVKSMRQAKKRRLQGKAPRRYCEHSYTGKDFCPSCS